MDRPSLRAWLVWRLSTKRRVHVGVALHAVRVLLHIGGFACLTFAASTVSLALGAVTLGLSLFTFSYLLSPGTDTTPRQPTDTPRR